MEAAVDAVLAAGYRTGDLKGRYGGGLDAAVISVGSAGMGDAIVAAINASKQ